MAEFTSLYRRFFLSTGSHSAIGGGKFALGLSEPKS